MKPAKKLWKRLCAAGLAMLLIAAMTVSAFAANEAVKDVADSIVRVELRYVKQGESLPLSIGTGIVIDQEYVITCNHVVSITDSVDRALMAETFGSDWEKYLVYGVYSGAGGQFMQASLVADASDARTDYATLKMKTKLAAKTPVQLGTSKMVDETDQVFMMGYPYQSYELEELFSDGYKMVSLDTREGIVNKIAKPNGYPTKMIKTNVKLLEGDSGGAMVNENGIVVGMNVAGNDNASYSLKIETVTDGLDQAGIPYQSANAELGESDEPVEPVDPPVEEVQVDTTKLLAAIESAETALSENLTDESRTEIQEKKIAAESAADSDDQSEIDSAASALQDAVANKEVKKNMMPIIIGLVAAAVVIVIIIIVIVATRKPSKEESYTDVVGGGSKTAQTGASTANSGFANTGFDNSAPQPAPNYAASGAVSGANETGVLGAGGAATGILNSGSAPTGVLSSKPYGQLTRKKDGSTVKVAANPFVIGKERLKVTYCIDNNIMVSRRHAQITSTGAGATLTDLNSKNGTFVNGLKCEPNAPMALKSGDIITLADEEFTFTSL